MFSSCVAPSSKSCHQIHFCHMASVPMQHHRNKERKQRTANQTRRLSSGTSALTVYTQHPRHLKSQKHRNLRLAAVALGTARCPCGVDDNTFLNAWTHASPERHQATGPQVERAWFARSLTAPPRCEPSNVWNVKWYTWVCQKRRDNCLQTSWLWHAGAICHCSTPHNL